MAAEQQEFVDTTVASYSESQFTTNEGEYEGAAPEEILINAAKRNAVDMMAEVIGDANVNAQDGIGNTALHYCAKYANVECAQLLFERDDLVLNFRNFNGDTALHYASESDCFEIAEVLIERRANPTIANKVHQRPLNMAQTDEMYDLIERACAAFHLGDGAVANFGEVDEDSDEWGEGEYGYGEGEYNDEDADAGEGVGADNNDSEPTGPPPPVPSMALKPRRLSVAIKLERGVYDPEKDGPIETENAAGSSEAAAAPAADDAKEEET